MGIYRFYMGYDCRAGGHFLVSVLGKSARCFRVRLHPEFEMWLAGLSQLLAKLDFQVCVLLPPSLGSLALRLPRLLCAFSCGRVCLHFFAQEQGSLSESVLNGGLKPNI